MKKAIKIFGILLLLFLYYNFISSNVIFPWKQKEAIAVTLNWGGLSELPDGMENLDITRHGNPFTRSFTIKFNASEKEIREWISNSKRLQANKPIITGETKIYFIHPGESDSYGGTVWIEKNLVKINMSWS